MSSLRARVQNGRLVLDEPTGLPDGTVVDLVADDEGDDLTDPIGRRCMRRWSAPGSRSMQAGFDRHQRSSRVTHTAVNLPVITTPEADTQIRAIGDWWRNNRPAAPDLFSEELAHCFVLLAQAPMIGKPYRRHASVAGLRRAFSVPPATRLLRSSARRGRGPCRVAFSPRAAASLS